MGDESIVIPIQRYLVAWRPELALQNSIGNFLGRFNRCGMLLGREVCQNELGVRYVLREKDVAKVNLAHVLDLKVLDGFDQ